MKRTMLIAVLMGVVVSCTPEEVAAPAPVPVPPQVYTPPVVAPAPVDENGLCSLNPPVNSPAFPREYTALETATHDDNLAAFIAALAGREPTDQQLRDALNQGSKRIVDWLCDVKSMSLPVVSAPPACAVPRPDSPDHPFPELDDEALAGLHLLFKAVPGIERDDAVMARLINCYCLYHYPRALRYLLSKGARPNGCDPKGRTPLDFAHYHQWQEGIDMLHAAGATAHTPGRSFAQKEELFLHHRCPSTRPASGGIPTPVMEAPFFIWQDPGPDGPHGGIICTKCKAAE